MNLLIPPPSAEPFPHVILDDLWDDEHLSNVVREFPHPDDPRWRRYGNANERKYEGPPEMWGEETRAFFAILEALAPSVGEAFGIPDLTMETVGGGYHLIPPGGRLEVHTDFNRSPTTGRFRRINFLTYLNKRWDDPGGYLALGRGDGRTLIAPEFNTSVLFETSDRSWHGHPVPTERRWRLSVAAYYFSAEPPPGYTEDHSTVWVHDA